MSDPSAAEVIDDDAPIGADDVVKARATLAAFRFGAVVVVVVVAGLAAAVAKGVERRADVERRRVRRTEVAAEALRLAAERGPAVHSAWQGRSDDGAVVVDTIGPGGGFVAVVEGGRVVAVGVAEP